MRLQARYALLDAATLARDVAVEVVGDTIRSVEVGVVATAEVQVDLLVPGFANAHSHSFHRALRGRADLGDDFWAWRQAMLRLAAHLDPDRLAGLAELVFRELVLGGYTTIAEFHYLHHGPGGHPYEEPNATGGALAEAARRAGVRLTLVDAAYLHAEPSASGSARPTGTLARFADPSLDAYLARVSALQPGSNLRIQLAAHSLRACTPQETAAIARTATAGWHLHLLEQDREAELVAKVWGARPAALLAELGVLGPELVAVHTNAATDAELALLARAGTVLCACPTTEEDLGDGLSPAGSYVELGGRVLVGSDEQVCASALTEAQRLAVHHRLASRDRRDLAPRALWAALLGHDALGWPEAGTITPGKLADLVAIDLDDPAVAGVDPWRVVALAGSAPIERVWVGGREVVRDPAAERAELAHQLDAFLTRLWKEV